VRFVSIIDLERVVADISQSILLVVMTTFGFYYQMKEQRGKPPFPPNRYAAVQEGVSETTALLWDEGVLYSDI
jgi:hypothetical protein